jgi:hypothetical protein
MSYWALSIVTVACFALMFVLLLVSVHQLRPKVFRVKAAVTKWIFIEVELQSPESRPKSLPSMKPPVAAAPASTVSAGIAPRQS